MTNLEPYHEFKEILSIGGNVTLANATAGQVTTFQINPDYYNFPHSIFRFTATYPHDPANILFIHAYADLLPHITRVRIYTNENKVLCDISEFNRMTKILGKIKTSCDHIVKNPFFNFDNSFGTILQKNNGASDRYDNTTPDSYYSAEPKYLFQGATSNTIDVTLEYNIELKDFFHTIFNEEPIINFKQKIFLEITWNRARDLCFYSTNALNPSATAVSYDQNVVISQISLQLCVQKNQLVNENYKKKIENEGHVIEFDYLTSLKTTSNGVSFLEWRNRIDKSFGNKLKYIHYAIFNGTQTTNNIYDASCLGTDKVVGLVSILNDKQLQNRKIYFDYEYFNAQREYIKKSCITDLNAYLYNFFWKENMNNFDLSNLCDYSLRLDVGTGSLAHYLFVLCTKKIVINKDGIQFIQ